ncbi:MAG: MoaD/ThiS family protein [Deltaproteobacteria bacterium]|nr:MoaD/ThiS family protein [Deltaproteobacteria bacterium]
MGGRLAGGRLAGGRARRAAEGVGGAPAPLEGAAPDGPLLRVVFLGAARERAGRAERLLPASAAPTLGALRDLLCAEHPPLVALAPSLRWAVNGAFEPHAARPLAPSDTVTLVPPFSEG